MTQISKNDLIVKENKTLKKEIAKLKKEINLLRKSFLPEEMYYKDRFYKINENVNNVVYRLTLPDGRYEYISPQCEDLFGYTADEFYTSPILVRHIIHPDFFSYFINHLKNLKKGDAPDYYEIKIIRKNGEVRWVQQKNLLIKNSDGIPVAIEGIVTDITDEKQIQEALIESEAQKKAILNNLPHLAWLKDCNGHYLSVNDSFAQSVNKKVEEVIGSTDFDLYKHEDAVRYREEDQQIIQNRKQIFIEEKMGDKYWETFKAPIFDSGGRVIGLTGISHDISKRKKVEEEIKTYSERLAIQNVKLQQFNDELTTAKEKAEESDKLKSAFLANMSHEIRTPMNAILGFATLLKNKKLTDKKRNEFIDLINVNCRQLLRIITDIIDISKIEAGQISIYNKNFNLNKALSDLVAGFRSQVATLKKSLDLIFKPELDDTQADIYTDKIRLEQILSNLLSNSIKFTDRGKVELGYYIRNKQELIFYVKDTGIGITPEEQTVIFERFRQVSTSYNKLYGGTGLGLSISKGLAEKLGGSIWLESEVEKGSTFYLSIPYKPAIVVNKTPQIQTDTNYNWSGKTILIAEDEEANFILLETLLKTTNAKVVWAKNGFETVNLCTKDNSIDLVLMDIKMPDMNGMEATKKIKKVRKSLPIIAQTAYAMSTDEDNCLRAGCDDYFAKPLKIETILEKINKYLIPKKNPTKSKTVKGKVTTN